MSHFYWKMSILPTFWQDKPTLNRMKSCYLVIKTWMQAIWIERGKKNSNAIWWTLAARLACFWYGVTYQTPIPTTWRESLKEQTNLGMSRGVWTSRVSTFLLGDWTLDARVLVLCASCLVCLRIGLKGWLACLGPNHRCTCLTGYTDLERTEPGGYGLSSQVPWCLHWKKDVDYLLIAKPVAINHLGIRRDCVE